MLQCNTPGYWRALSGTHYTGITSAALVFQSLAGLSPHITDDCYLVFPTVIFALLTPEPVSFPDQTLGLGSEVSHTLVQKYGTVCRLYSDSLA